MKVTHRAIDKATSHLQYSTMAENKPMPKPPPTATRINDQGLVEIVDLFTGRVLTVQSTPHDDYLKNRFENLVRIETEEGPVFIEKHIDPDKVMRYIKNTKQARSQPQFSLTWAELIGGHLLEGKTLTQATLALGLSLATVKRWKLENAEFKAILDRAKQARAETFQDEALESARKHQDLRPDLHVQTLMKQAAQDDAEQYGTKQKVEHSGTVAHTIVVETGIRRNQLPPEGFEDAIRDATPTNEDRGRLSPGTDLLGEGQASATREEPTPAQIEESIWKPGREAEEVRPNKSRKQVRPEPLRPTIGQTSRQSLFDIGEASREAGPHDRQGTMAELPEDSEF